MSKYFTKFYAIKTNKSHSVGTEDNMIKYTESDSLDTVLITSSI